MFKKLIAAIIILAMLLSFAACQPVADNSGTSGGTTTGRPSEGGSDSGTTPPEIPEVVNLDFYVTNDLHGNVTDDTNQGIGKTSTYLKSVSKTENAVLISSGDMWQGSSESNNTKGALVTEWMNVLDFSAMTLGNHEFDWGDQYIYSNESLAEFPFLAINIYDENTNALAGFCQPSVMIERSGVSIGIIGAIGDCYSSIAEGMVDGYRFAVRDELTQLVKNEATRLRSEGADLIVYSLHDGLGRSYSTSYDRTLSDGEFSSYYDVSLSNGYVDLVFEGHTHQSYVVKDSYGVYHLQAGSSNKYFAHVDMNFNTVTDKIVTAKGELTYTSIFSNLPPDSETEALFDKYAEQIGNVYEVLGQNVSKRGSDELRYICSELYLEAGLAKWGKEYNIVLGGGYMSCRSPYNLYVGDVCYKDLQSLFPFDNPIVLASISGKYLKSKFIYTENENYFVTLSEYGENILTSIKDDEIYYVITDTYSSEYSPNKMTTVAYLSSPDTYARDLLAEYAKRGGFNS